MENTKNNIHYLKYKSTLIDKDIDKQVEVVYDELKSYIEILICSSEIHRNILIREAMFGRAMATLKNLVWEKLCNLHNIKMSE